MTKLHSKDLGEFVKMVDRDYAGNLADPALASRYYPLEFEFDTVVDQDLEPFSDEYYQHQLTLYKEISGRELNQWDGELHPVDIPSLLETPNPLGVNNVTFISEHVRAISSMLGLACLSPVPKVLDMGAGHGLSSEVLAFCGAIVKAVDIDPALSELSQRRAESRNLSITRSVLNFDDLSTIESSAFEAAFFFQSLHHCIRPWDLIGTLKTKLTADGVIAFTGEPIGSVWRNWGIRLDQESVYVARKFGWFESGWSHAFLRSCFASQGFKLRYFGGGHGGGEIGVASVMSDRLDRCAEYAASVGYLERHVE
ncbi:MAG: class I SAM-dependent methyltransferase [Sphingomonas sp.]|nr:class I SAM-dependent methyltransferase [Sphingomonas sp.]